ncbi:MAG: hypothetical protein LBD67_10885 [Candidatus Accumulibacter sp.]|nr:hypothetical protein [Accumulibacter sp.]
MPISVRAEPAEPSTARVFVRADFAGTHGQRLSPFVLSLSKYERTLCLSGDIHRKTNSGLKPRPEGLSLISC